jgi:hypothetical protein
MANTQGVKACAAAASMARQIPYPGPHDSRVHPPSRPLLAGKAYQ